MAWNPVGNIQLSRNWQYTEPVTEGDYFRIKHSEAKKGALFAIAQCEVDANGYISIGDTQVLEAEKGINDVVKLPKGAFIERRIAVKRFDTQPNLEQEIRRLFLPNFLIFAEQEINYIRRNNWTLNIEVSDFVEIVDSNYTSRFDAVDSQLIEIQQRLNNINTNDENINSDPYFSSAVLLTHFDSNFTDVKGKIITPFGNAQISTAQSKFGSASSLFDGSGDYLEIPHSADFNLGNSDFTIEFFIRFNSVSGQQTFLGKWQGPYPNNVEFLCFKNPSGQLEIALYNFDNTQSNFTTIWSPVINQWYFISFVRKSNEILFFIDGNLQQSFAYSKSIKTTTAPLWIGGEQAINSNFFNGYLDELRFSKGIARYTANFTSPTTSFPSN